MTAPWPDAAAAAAAPGARSGAGQQRRVAGRPRAFHRRSPSLVRRVGQRERPGQTFGHTRGDAELCAGRDSDRGRRGRVSLSVSLQCAGPGVNGPAPPRWIAPAEREAGAERNQSGRTVRALGVRNQPTDLVWDAG
eukprot:357958-Chlamydomonas_euryale.AAC.7